MIEKVTENDKVKLAGQLIARRAILKDKRTRLFLRRAEHPLYQVMSTMLKTISIKDEEGVPDHDLIQECKKVRKKIQKDLKNSLEYIEYLRAIVYFKEIKELYIFSKSN